MGNANGKGDGETVNGELTGKAGVDAQSSREGGRGVGSLGTARSTPPESPRQPQAPLVFSPQVPVAPLQRTVVVPAPNSNSPLPNDHSNEPSALPAEKGVPTMITWNHGGKDVAVEGSWDNWRSRKVLQRSGKDHFILLVLPSGVFRYRFIVDGQQRWAADLPAVSDEMGLTVNLLDVHEYVPQNLETARAIEAPPSPDSTYGRPYPAEEELAKEPSPVPPQLHATALGEPALAAPPPHVVLDHLFMEKGWTSQSLVALGLTHRFRSKYVTVVLYKPLSLSPGDSISLL